MDDCWHVRPVSRHGCPCSIVVISSEIAGVAQNGETTVFLLLVANVCDQ
jgi:hypothetical protein